MSKPTPLHAAHVDAGGKMVDFAGWRMPLHYGSQIAEHHVVRQDAGMFDVSHMTVVDVSGAGALEYLRRLVANDVAKLAAAGKALYGTLLNEAGGVIDDLIVYRRAADYRLVVNAATRDKVLPWLQDAAGADVTVSERDLACCNAHRGRGCADGVFFPRARELYGCPHGVYGRRRCGDHPAG